jgi:hypothetical protein
MGLSDHFHASTALLTREIGPCTNRIRGAWVPRAGLDVVAKRKIPSGSWTPDIQPGASRYADIPLIEKGRHVVIKRKLGGGGGGPQEAFNVESQRAGANYRRYEGNM